MIDDLIYDDTDDVKGDTRIRVWTNGCGDLHVGIFSTDDYSGMTVYIRNGEKFAKTILKEVW